MVESFLRMTQILEKQNFQSFFKPFLAFFEQILNYFLAKNGFKNSTMTTSGISSRQFWRDNCMVLLEYV